jgi:hypothetical protein
MLPIGDNLGLVYCTFYKHPVRTPARMVESSASLDKPAWMPGIDRLTIRK